MYKRGDSGLERTELPELTQEQIQLAEYYERPAGIDKIMSYLELLAMRKRLDTKDQSRVVFIMADDARRLAELHISEVIMSIMVNHFIENDESAFYPQYAAMKKAIGK